MPNDITVTKNTTSGSERWDIQYTADQAGTIDKTLLTAGKLLDRNEKVSITIPSGSAATPATTITPNDIAISVNSSTGLITASNTQKTQSVTPTVSSGYVSSGTAGTITVSAKSATSQLSTQAGTTISPTESEQTVVAANKYTLGAVKVGAISSTYVGSGITQRDSDDLTVSGATVTAPAGYYASSASKSVASMTLPTSASSTSSGTSKATISRSTSDQYINIPTGYNGTASYYKVSATPNGSATTPATTIYSIPTMSIDSATGIVSAVNNESQSVTPTVSAGYISSGTAGTITVSGGASMSLSTQAAKTVTPSTSNQTAVAAGKYTTGAVTVAGDANLIAGNIKKDIQIFGVTGTYNGEGITLQSKTVSPTTSQQTVTADTGYDALSQVTVNAMPVMTLPTSTSSTSSGTSKATIGRSTSAQYINIPTGYNSAAAYYTISATPNGSVTAPSSISGSSATVSTGTNTLTLTKTVSVTPNVTTAGYISSGTAGNSSVSLTANVTTKAAATITPSTTNQTITSGTYLTGTQTILGDANLIPANIANGVTIFGVTGTHQGGGAIISTTQDSHGGEILTITTTGNVSYLQSKTVTPTSSVQIITPDSGYDGLSEVIVNAGSASYPAALGRNF